MVVLVHDATHATEGQETRTLPGRAESTEGYIRGPGPRSSMSEGSSFGPRASEDWQIPPLPLRQVSESLSAYRYPLV